MIGFRLLPSGEKRNKRIRGGLLLYELTAKPEPLRGNLLAILKNVETISTPLAYKTDRAPEPVADQPP